MARRRRPDSTEQLALAVTRFEEASLVEETRRRYLGYALSVITSRALPDVRDGLKPVQRRILYAMWDVLRLRPEARHRKSAAVVGEVMGKLHPHGDAAIYDAMARMAQPFTMRVPLVDGRGNFGSPDGDPPAAMRYTEARLAPLAVELLAELGQRTVPFRPNYDGQHQEPVVLPARLPHLLINGSQGIAVGMATSIPPHNPAEVIDAAVRLIDDPETPLQALLEDIRGPDFPTGGELVASEGDLLRIYTEGHGSLKLRGTWRLETRKRAAPLLVIDSIPYGVERRSVVEKIADVILSRKMPLLLDVRDESTSETRIVCELKRGADPQLAMAYLYRHTPLSVNVQVNLTCLVPVGDPEHQRIAPRRLSLHESLHHFLRFRMQVLVRRLEFELEKLRERIHLLEGFETLFDALDEALALIRGARDRKDAAARLQEHLSLSERQTDAILQMPLYKLARLEIEAIRKELRAKRREARRIERLLGDEAARWRLLREELHALKERYGEPRRTRRVAPESRPRFEAEDFIVAEDAVVVVTEQGWVKRQQSVRDPSTVRLREGDRLLALVPGSTRSSVAFFSNRGSCYVSRIADLPATRGYGVPLGSLFKLGDGERIVAVLGFDPRLLAVPEPSEGASPPFAMAVTARGMGLRFALSAHREPSTRTGRRYCRLREGDEVRFVGVTRPDDTLAVASRMGRALLCAAEEVKQVAGPGLGVRVIKLQDEDEVLGAALLGDEQRALVVRREGGAEYRITRRRYDVVSRGGKGFQLFKRGRLEGIVRPPPQVPPLAPEDASG